MAIGWGWADPAIGLLITGAILLVLRTAARDVFRRLMDGIEPELVEAAQRRLGATPGVIGVDDLRMRWIGHEIHAEAIVEIDSALDFRSADATMTAAEQSLLDTSTRVSRAVVRARCSPSL